MAVRTATPPAPPSERFTDVTWNVADLVGLAISQGTLTPVFAAGTISYTASVTYGVASLTVTPTGTTTAGAGKIRIQYIVTGRANEVQAS